MNGNFGSDNFVPPVREGEEIDVRVEAVGEKGDGIAKRKGFVIFVPGTKQGEEVRIRITKVMKKVSFSEVIGEPKGPIEDNKPKKNSTVEMSADEANEEPVEEYDSSKDTEDF